LVFSHIEFVNQMQPQVFLQIALGRIPFQTKVTLERLFSCVASQMNQIVRLAIVALLAVWVLTIESSNPILLILVLNL
jgi:hypothetical protein